MRSTGTTRAARLAAGLFASAALLFAAAPAQAEFGIESFDTDTHLPNTDPGTGVQGEYIPGRHTSQAGAHADSTVRFRFRTKADAVGDPIPDGAVKDVELDLPAGFAGNPQAVPQCDPVQFVNLLGGSCPANTQVGVANTEIGPAAPNFNIPWYTPVYNLRPAEGQTAVFGFYIVFVPVKIVATVRTDGDYGLRTTVSNISQASNVFAQELTLWGNPADPVHDFERYAQGQLFPPGAPSSASRRPFLTLPPACNGEQRTSLRVTAWDGRTDSDVDIADDPDTGDTSGPKGCDRLAFDASLDFQPGETRAGSPSGYTARVTVPQNGSSNALGTPNVKDVQVTLPEGVAISPSSADGLQSCTAAQLKLGSREDQACPAGSKIGDVEIETPLLPGPLTGEIYLRAQTPQQTFAIAIVARGYGLTIKLPGEIDPNQQTGQIVTTFRNNPQLPFEQLTLRFKGGPRAPLTNPQTCGPKTTSTTITSWAGHNVTSTDSFTVDKGPDGGPCRPLGFAPRFSAGTMNPVGGASATFALAFGRSDGDQDLSAIDVQMPNGLTGKLALADQCPEGLAGNGGCTEGSRVGSVTVASGAGSTPFNLPGRVYMTGPYKGAPLGLSIVVPAVAGPFDLGTVVVRAAVHVDRRTAALRVISDPMPTILQGVPLRVRNVEVRIDRDGFMINPTDCNTKAVTARIGSTFGSVAAASSRFRVADCRSRPVKPKMVLQVGARGKLTRGKRTPFTATLTQVPGEGNLKSVEVTLPKVLNSRLDVVNRRRACTIEQFTADRCPMVVGTGTAVTPLLRDPLAGPAYFVYNPDRRLPDLVVRLKGQVNVDLVGKVTITRDLRLRTTFDTVPDVPISKFRLALESGSTNGPIGVVTNLCSAQSRAARAELKFLGHNGKRLNQAPKLRVNGCGKARSNSRAGSRSAGRRSASRRAAKKG